MEKIKKIINIALAMLTAATVLPYKIVKADEYYLQSPFNIKKEVLSQDFELRKILGLVRGGTHEKYLDGNRDDVEISQEGIFVLPAWENKGKVEYNFIAICDTPEGKKKGLFRLENKAHHKRLLAHLNLTFDEFRDKEKQKKYLGSTSISYNSENEVIFNVSGSYQEDEKTPRFDISLGFGTEDLMIQGSVEKFDGLKSEKHTLLNYSGTDFDDNSFNKFLWGHSEYKENRSIVFELGHRDSDKNDGYIAKTGIVYGDKKYNHIRGFFLSRSPDLGGQLLFALTENSQNEDANREISDFISQYDPYDSLNFPGLHPNIRAQLRIGGEEREDGDELILEGAYKITENFGLFAGMGSRAFSDVYIGTMIKIGDFGLKLGAPLKQIDDLDNIKFDFFTPKKVIENYNGNYY